MCSAHRVDAASNGESSRSRQPRSGEGVDVSHRRGVFGSLSAYRQARRADVASSASRHQTRKPGVIRLRIKS